MRYKPIVVVLESGKSALCRVVRYVPSVYEVEVCGNNAVIVIPCYSISDFMRIPRLRTIQTNMAQNKFWFTVPFDDFIRENARLLHDNQK